MGEISNSSPTDQLVREYFTLQWWPLLARKDLLDYVERCERDDRSKFIGKSLVHALKFFRFVMQANFNVETVVGPLLQGRVLRVLSTRDPTEQARALTVEEIKKLEEIVACAKNVLDR